jgi:hypothetical protein
MLCACLSQTNILLRTETWSRASTRMTVARPSSRWMKNIGYFLQPETTLQFAPIILEGGVKQDSFLIEARSIAGYSGSPVFLHFIPQPGLPPNMPEGARLSMPDYILKRQFTQYGIPYEPYLLGIDYCHIFSKDRVFNRHTDKPHDDWYVKSNTGMMGVIPAWKLTAMLEGPEMKSIIESKRALLPIARLNDGV